MPVTSENGQSDFSVESNSTVTDLAFNSASQELSFTVSGPSGTTGYVDAYKAKSLMETFPASKSTSTETSLTTLPLHKVIPGSSTSHIIIAPT